MPTTQLGSHQSGDSKRVKSSRRSPALVPLARHLDELFSDSRRQQQELASHVSCSIDDDVIPEGGAYIVPSRTDTLDARFKFSFFSIPLPDGGVCLADYGADRLCVLTSGGLQQPFGLPGRGSGELTHPLGLALTPSGGLLVADDADRVQLLDEAGNAMRLYGAPLRRLQSDALSRAKSESSCAAPKINTEAQRDAAWLPHRSGTVTSTTELQSGEMSWMATDRLCAAREPIDCAATTPSCIECRRLRQPYGVACGPGGRVYVADKGLQNTDRTRLLLSIKSRLASFYHNGLTAPPRNRS